MSAEVKILVEGETNAGETAEAGEEKTRPIISLNKKRRNILCKKCKKIIEAGDNCLCRPWLCYSCCECQMDCDVCSCSHKQK